MKRVFLTIFFILSINIIVFAAPSTVEFTYDFNKTSENDSLMHYTSSVLLTINTPTETDCFYTTVQGASPGNPFDKNYGTKHEKVIENLEDKLHKYYIRCGPHSQNPIMEILFKTKETVSGNIEISNAPPLKTGTYRITLTTSSHIMGEPSLEYSLDSSTFKKIPLSGTGTSWSGHLIINEKNSETIGSFRFKATDLDGKEGTTITGDKVFIVDTKPPELIQTFEATGYQGQIFLSWYSEESIDKFNIYRSENPGIDQNDFFKATSDDEYTDNDVSNGKTYYYRIAGVDDAANIGQLSREMYATALLSNKTSETGLNPKLIGNVDNKITEVKLLIEDITAIQNSISSKEEKEKILFNELELNKEHSSSISELESIKKDIERFKLQDLSEIELNNKLNSAQLKIDIIRRKTPETITIINENSIKREFSEEKISEIILEYGQESLSQKEIDKTITQTKKLLEEKEVSVNSEIFNIEIVYLDGTKNEISVIKDTINSQIEGDDNIKFLLLIPKEIAEKASEISFKTSDYQVIKEDPLISFDSNIKQLIYTIDRHITTTKIEDISLIPIHIFKEDISAGVITGNSILNSENLSYTNIGYIVLGIIFLILIAYFISIKRRSPELKEIKIKLIEAEKIKGKGNKKELGEKYQEIKEIYKKLIEKERRKIYPRIKKLHSK